MALEKRAILFEDSEGYMIPLRHEDHKVYYSLCGLRVLVGYIRGAKNFLILIWFIK